MASYIFLAGIGVIVTGFAIAWGTVRIPNTALYILLIILCGLLRGRLALTVATIASSLAVAALAYAESLSAVAYIIDYYNIYDIQRIIKSLADGKDLNSIFKEVLLLDYDGFYQKWKEYLTSKYYN